MRTVFLTLGLFIASTLPALAASPHNTYTHNTAFAVPEQSYQLAATWFLPDWQAGLVSRTDTAPTGSGDRHDLTCSVYGGCLGIPANMTCSDDFTVDGKTCYKSCSCKSGFVPVSSSDICKGCVNPCDARTAVDAPYGCEKYFSDCASKCEKAYADNCRNRTAVSVGSYGCKTYFTDCPSKCQTAYTDNCHIRTAVSTPYGCEKYFSDCSSKCEKAYPDNCRNRIDNATDYGCEKYWNDCPTNCEKGKICTPKNCSAYPLTTIPSNAFYEECIEGCSNTQRRYKINLCVNGYALYLGKCVNDTCPSGTQKNSCDTDQIYEGFENTERGTICYRCRTKNCYDYGSNYYPSEPTGKSCTRVAKGNIYCYTNCCDNSCPSGYQKTDCNAQNAGWVGMPDQNQDIQTNACGCKCYLCKSSSSCTSKCTSTFIPLGASAYKKECNKYYCATACKTNYKLNPFTGTCTYSGSSSGGCSCPSGTYSNRPSCSKPSTIKGNGTNCCCYKCDGLGRVSCLTNDSGIGGGNAGGIF